jgi:hypothetical protein
MEVINAGKWGDLPRTAVVTKSGTAQLLVCPL